MSSDFAVKLEGVSKSYPVYKKPSHRLLQMLSLGRKKLYDDYWALHDVSFEVKKGESVGIIGRNGSGKSTLLQIITGTLSPSSGIVMTSGRIAALLELGSGFNPEFTGRENVYLNASLLGLSQREIDNRFDDIASFADIGHYLNQPVKTYSSGMMLRLAFAVQVQVSPDILIVDEALAVGDALFQKRCFQRIEKLTSDGTTLLFVSHEQESIRTLTNRALLLNKGRVLNWGKSSDVVLSYRKLLHQEEASYFSDIATKIEKEKQEISFQSRGSEPSTERSSFGDCEVSIKCVRVLGSNGEDTSVFYPGDVIHVQVECVANIEIEKINVSLRLRNKEGVKIHSWGTLNQDMRAITHKEGDLFWRRFFSPGENFSVHFTFVCNLGVNLYEIQAAVSYEDTPDYMSQRMLHWCDEAAFFQVLQVKEENFFGGVVDLKMAATW